MLLTNEFSRCLYQSDKSGKFDSINRLIQLFMIQLSGGHRNKMQDKKKRSSVDHHLFDAWQELFQLLIVSDELEVARADAGLSSNIGLMGRIWRQKT